MKNLAFATLILCLLVTAGIDVRFAVYAVNSGFEPLSFNWTDASLLSVFMLSASDGWTVGSYGTILHWDGTAWKTIASPPSYWHNSVFMLNSSDGWAVGSGGTIIHWNGTEWTQVTGPLMDDLYGIYMTNATDGWAVGSVGWNGAILHWNGTEWTKYISTPKWLFSVFMTNNTNGWAVGDPSNVFHWNGTSWTTFSNPTGKTLFSVFMVNASDGWAVGDFGLILHWNGTEWAISQSPVYLGDLTISGNDVYVIEGVFSINGSIIVEENATLILRNATLNFTQTAHNQFSMIFQNAVDGNPRLIIENSSILTNNYALDINFWDNSTAEINELFTNEYIEFSLFYQSSISISNSTCPHSYISAQQYSSINASNSTLDGISAWDPTNVLVSNCTLNEAHAGSKTNFLTSNCIIKQYLGISTFDANYTVNGLKPGFFHYWNFPLNCSAAGVSIPNLTLEDTFVANWNFYPRAHTNATFSNSNLYTVTLREFSQGTFYNTILDTLNTYDYSTVHSFDSEGNTVYAHGNSRIWAINSTAFNPPYIYDQAEIYIYYYLDVHVIDSVGQNIPYANVTAKYSNSSTAETKLTGSSGWARLTLMQGKTNATGFYSLGNYTVIGEYEGYSENASIDMFGNQIITLRLPFVIPEFAPYLIMLTFMATTLLLITLRKRKMILSKS